MLTTRAPARSSRLAGAASVLLLQGAFFLLFLTAAPVLRPPAQETRDLMLRLPRFYLPPPPPPAPGKGQALPGPVTVTPPLPLLQSPPGNAITQPAPQTGLLNFGQALNNCAPENYAKLTPEQRARCAGPGVMVDKEPDALVTRGHAKGEAMFQEQWDEKHWMPGLCDPSEGIVAFCIMHQSMAEAQREADVNWHLARDHAAALKPPPPPVPPK